MKKKLIGFSLWGNNPIYTIGAIRNAELSKVYFPDWELMFIVGKSVPQNIPEKLIELDCLVIKTDKEEDFTGMFWRFCGVNMSNYDYFLSRDCDSRLSMIEAREVNDWIGSGKMFHSILAHPHHNIPILGGLWGAKINTKLTEIFESSLSNFKLENRYQIDQHFLIKHIFPFVKDDIYYSNMIYKEQKPDYSFIGEGYNEHDEPLIAENRMILNKYYNLINKKNG